MPAFKKFLSGNVTFIKSPFYIKYGVPILLLVWATLFKLLLVDLAGIHTPFLLYFAVVLITSRYFGERAAIVVTILAALAANYFFLYPYNAFSTDTEHLLQSGMFIIECCLVIGLSSALIRATQSIHQQDLVFKALVEKSMEGITMHNAEGVRTYCSPSVERILGYSVKELFSHKPWQLSHEEELIDVKEQFYRLASHPGTTVTVLHRLKHKDGHWMWIESRLTNLLHDPLINAIISNFSDVTKRIELEKQREDFIGIASHELKTPLTSLKAFTQVLENRFKTGHDRSSHEIITKVDFQVNRIVSMINDMLDVSSLQAGGLQFHIVKFNLNELIDEVSATLQHTSKKHRITTQLIPVEDIPGDKDRIAQVLTNFILNAIKYSPDADTVDISTKIEGAMVTVFVQDHGIGIPGAEQKNVFEKFYRVGQSQKAFQGLGLGLFICSQITEMHHGKIGVISEEGKGSTFWFSLPM